jgi:hypothetical protein
MYRTWLAGAVGLAALLAASVAAWGADEQPGVSRRPVLVRTEIVSSCRAVWRCGSYGCGWQKTCPRRCPDRYSCHSLYGAYGPYGGVGYWGRYFGSGGTYP